MYCAANGKRRSRGEIRNRFVVDNVPFKIDLTNPVELAISSVAYVYV